LSTPSAVRGGYPVTLRIAGRPCLVVGGGPVAIAKAVGLADCGGVVTVVAPALDPEAAGALDRPEITVERRRYEPGETARYCLVITATGIGSVDQEVASDAERSRVWVNAADDVENCSFTLPSVHRDGSVTIAVSTGGASPALAAWLRRRLGRAAGAGLGELADALGTGRRRVHEGGRPTASVDWTALLDGELPALVRDGRLEEASHLVDEAVALSGIGRVDRKEHRVMAAPPSRPSPSRGDRRAPTPTGRSPGRRVRGTDARRGKGPGEEPDPSRNRLASTLASTRRHRLGETAPPVSDARTATAAPRR